jgi:predicted transposase YdaD
MRQDKDRSGKWLLTHHGDAVLKLAGLTGFTHWKALQAETVAPRRLPDGLLEVRFPDASEPVLVLVEIETYPDSDADRQVLDDLMLIAVDRNIVPAVVSLVLKPKGKLTVAGSSERVSSRGGTRIGGSWPVVRLWELEADTLLGAGDAGLVPWVPLTKTALAPEALMARCHERLMQVANPNDRAGLMAVTQILAGLAFPDKRFLDLFGGAETMIESPVLDEVKEILKKRYEAEGAAKATRQAIRATLEARFGTVPAERVVPLEAVADENRLKELVRLAATCADLDAFVAGLTAAK